MTVNFNNFMTSNLNALGKNVQKPNAERNYTLYDKNRVESIAKYGNYALPYVENYLKEKRSDDEIFEALAIIDKMADYQTPELYKIYPVLSKYNDTNSPEIQVMLSGIYRKILIPDAFGPLCKMLYKQITKPETTNFDPTEETGGAILEYIRNYGNTLNPAMYPAFNYKTGYKPPINTVIAGYSGIQTASTPYLNSTSRFVNTF